MTLGLPKIYEQLTMLRGHLVCTPFTSPVARWGFTAYPDADTRWKTPSLICTFVSWPQSQPHVLTATKKNVPFDVAFGRHGGARFVLFLFFFS